MSADFYARLDRKEQEDRIARIFKDRPDNLHDYQGCANDEARKAEKMTDRPREVDPDGKCGKCGGLHYGTGWHCVYPTCTHCSRPITCVGQRCSNDALCMPIEENKR